MSKRADDSGDSKKVSSVKALKEKTATNRLVLSPTSRETSHTPAESDSSKRKKDKKKDKKAKKKKKEIKSEKRKKHSKSSAEDSPSTTPSKKRKVIASERTAAALDVDTEELLKFFEADAGSEAKSSVPQSDDVLARMKRKNEARLKRMREIEEDKILHK